MSSPLTVVSEKVIIFSEHISLVAAIKHNLMNSTTVNAFLNWLSNEPFETYFGFTRFLGRNSTLMRYSMLNFLVFSDIVPYGLDIPVLTQVISTYIVF